MKGFTQTWGQERQRAPTQPDQGPSSVAGCKQSETGFIESWPKEEPKKGANSLQNKRKKQIRKALVNSETRQQLLEILSGEEWLDLSEIEERVQPGATPNKKDLVKLQQPGLVERRYKKDSDGEIRPVFTVADIPDHYQDILSIYTNI
ncbi:hypothetical protein [Haloarcula argentinensis]|uniref:Uncharacterized protein n=1 Tax=Haloarcula argentinensis TaxID=43776 RepID=A0A830FE12_HALAR|nr:hypothetical protein [Haloarcula argentinensis]GGM40106.1 hypothetical protein GCM10009006_21510 [Haloarcula argentinensis]